MLVQTAKLIQSSRLTIPTCLIQPAISQLYVRLRSYSYFCHRLNPQTKYFPVIITTAGYKECGPKQEGGGSSKYKYKPYIKKPTLTHDEKNMRLKRPMSPHLDIYGPTVPAMTSIVQRITGAMVTVYALGLAAVALWVPKGVTGFIEYVQSWDFPEPLIIAVKTVIASSFAFHYLFGIRFTGFNMGKLLDLKTAYSSAYVCIVLSLVCGVAGALIGHVYSFQ